MIATELHGWSMWFDQLNCEQKTSEQISYSKCKIQCLLNTIIACTVTEGMEEIQTSKQKWQVSSNFIYNQQSTFDASISICTNC